MSGLGRGYQNMKEYVGTPFTEAFGESASWYFNTLFKKESIKPPQSNYEGLKNIAAFLGILIPTAVAIGIGITVALVYHSISGLIDAIRWTAKYSWPSQEEEVKPDPKALQKDDVKPGRNPLQEVFAIPGYLISLPFCAAISLGRVLWYGAEPIVEGFVDAVSLGFSALFDSKEKSESTSLKANKSFLRKEHDGARRIPAFIGHVAGFALAALVSPVALIYHTVLGFIDVASWSVKRILLNSPNIEIKDISRQRYGLQHALASPGYAFAMVFFVPFIAALRASWEILKPFGQAFGQAVSLGFKALFTTKKAPTDESALVKEDKPFLRDEHAGPRRIPAFVGHVAGFVLAALVSPVALIYHTVLGFIDVATWSVKRILLNDSTVEFNTTIRQRYSLQHALASPGYALAMVFFVPFIAALSASWEILKPFGQAFVDATSLGFKALFTAKEKAGNTLRTAGDPLLKKHAGLRRIPAFIGHVAGFALTALVSPLALIGHTVLGFIDVATWSVKRILLNDSTIEIKDISRQRYGLQHALASPGYALAIVFFVPFIAALRASWEILKPFGQAFGQAVSLGFKALFTKKKAPTDESALVKEDKPFLRDEHEGLRRIPAFIGHLAGFALTALISPIALIVHTVLGFIDVASWSLKYILFADSNTIDSVINAFNEKEKQALTLSPIYILAMAFSALLYKGTILKRSGFQNALASPGYALAMVFFVPFIAALRASWEILKPFGQAFVDATSLGFKALFTAKETAGNTLRTAGEPLLKKHEGLRRIPAFIGHVAGFALTALVSPLALIGHTVLGFIDVAGWSVKRILLNSPNIEIKDISRQRYGLQHALASPGYALAMVFFVPFIVALRASWEVLKPFGIAFTDALALSGKMLFLDRVPDPRVKAGVVDSSNELTIGANADKGITYKPLGGLPPRAEEHAGLRQIPAFFGHLAAFALAVYLSAFAFAWHSISGFLETVNWGIKRIVSRENNNQPFRDITAHRYPEQHGFALIGYVLGGLVCITLAPFCLIYKHREELKNGMTAGVTAFATMLPVLLVSTLKSFLLVVYNLFAFLGNALTGQFRDAGLALERAFVHFLGFISLGLLDAVYRSLTGRPPLIRTSTAVNSQDPEAQKEAESAIALQTIYNLLNYDGDVELKALDIAMDQESAEKPSFSHTLARRMMKSSGAEFGLDSPVEEALKDIAEKFKEENEQGSESKVAPTADPGDAKKGFFARNRHHEIIQKNKNKYDPVIQKSGLNTSEIKKLAQQDTELAKLANLDKSKLNQLKTTESGSVKMLDKSKLTKLGMTGLAALDSSILTKLAKLDKSELFKLTEVIQLEKLDIALTQSIDEKVHHRGMGT